LLTITGRASFLGNWDIQVTISGGAQVVEFEAVAYQTFSVDVPLNPGLNKLHIDAHITGPPGCHSQFDFDVVFTGTTPRPSPTPTNTCTPGPHPAPGCEYEGPTFTATEGPSSPTPTPTTTPTTPLPSVTPSATPTVTPAASGCVGDCNRDGQVSVDEILTMVDIMLNGNGGACPAADQWCSGPPIDVVCIIKAVNNALNDCPPRPTATPAATPTMPPPVSFEVQLDRPAGSVRISARLTNTSDHALFYLAGCSALCRPEFYRAVSFHVSGPDGAEVIVKSPEYPYPCEGPLFCPEFPQQISPGESVEETLDIDGTAWKQDSTAGGFCGVCTADPFTAGRYQVTARGSYSTDPGRVYSPTQVENTAEFDWP
jgi:hypothetical protein